MFMRQAMQDEGDSGLLESITQVLIRPSGLSIRSCRSARKSAIPGRNYAEMVAHVACSDANNSQECSNAAW